MHCVIFLMENDNSNFREYNFQKVKFSLHVLFLLEQCKKSHVGSKKVKISLVLVYYLFYLKNNIFRY